MSSRGGARPGAGRPPKADNDKNPRPQHQMRAYEDEWVLIKRFSKIVKNSNLKETEKTIEILERKQDK